MTRLVLLGRALFLIALLCACFGAAERQDDVLFSFGILSGIALMIAGQVFLILGLTDGYGRDDDEDQLN